MNVKHLATLQTALHYCVPTAVGVYRGGCVVASPGSCRGSDVCLWHLFSISGKKLTLSGHREPVTALAFSSHPLTTNSPPTIPPTLLCSASNDRVLLWDMEQCHQHDTEDGLPRGHLLPSPEKGPVSSVCFSPHGQHVAVCQRNAVLIFQSESRCLDTTLVGHSAPVTCAVFSSHHHHTILTASEDRSFKVWDLALSSLIYQSPIVSASPFLCAAVDPHRDLMAIGAADGKLRVYDLATAGGYTCLHECDVSKELEKLKKMATDTIDCTATNSSVIHSASPWQLSHDHHVTGDTPTSVEIGPAILGVYYWYNTEDLDTESEAIPPLFEAHPSDAHISAILREPPSLLVVTHLGLSKFNANTLELVEHLDFRDPISAMEGPQQLVPAVASCDFVYNPTDGELYCAFGAMFHNTISVLNLGHQQANGPEGKACAGQDLECVISVLSSVPLVPNSPLRAEFTLKTKPAASSVKNPSAMKGKPHRGVTDQPLTFKNKVKSSGYSETPRTKMFTPKTNLSGQKGSAAKRNASRKAESYPMSCGATTHLLHSTSLCDRPAAINEASFSGDGRYLSCASADKAVYVMKMPPQSSGRSHVFVGHDGAVYSTSWSHDGQWLLSCSGDRTARVWSLGQKDPLLSITTTLHNLRAEDVAGKSNVPFSKEITHAQFYYLDKFITLTCGNSLYLYKYHIDTAKPDDIKRYQSNSRYKLVKSFAMESAVNITAMSCINDFYSYIVLVAGSNKSLEVYDMNVGQGIRTIADIHSRPVTGIVQNKGSRYTTHHPTAYDLFLTSAVTDGIKLWDLRTNRCVCRFTSHQNRTHPVSAAISPCARFIATGSEDRAAYIYALHSSSPLHKLTGHSDVVSTLTYHPLKPMLATFTLDGQAKIYNDIR